MDHFIHDHLSCAPRFLDYDEGITEYLQLVTSVKSLKYAFFEGKLRIRDARTGLKVNILISAPYELERKHSHYLHLTGMNVV